MSSTCEFPMLLVVIALAAVGAVALFFLSRKSGGAQESKPEDGKAPVLRDVEEEYRLGMDPRASGKPVMYTLQTCLHCVHLKHFMDGHGIEHHLVYVDDFRANSGAKSWPGCVLSTPEAPSPRWCFPTARYSLASVKRRLASCSGSRTKFFSSKGLE